MPESTPELAWWVMTGAIAGLLSLLTLLVGCIAYFSKTGFDRIVQRLDQQQEQGIKTDRQVAEHMALCRERHERLDREIADMKESN